ncbi:hypothetical protein [Streptomyces sp. NPDC004014]
MDAVRVFAGLEGELRGVVGVGLGERVRVAVFDRACGRWRLFLTPEQMDAMAYGLWLHALAGGGRGGQPLPPRLRRPAQGVPLRSSAERTPTVVMGGLACRPGPGHAATAF